MSQKKYELIPQSIEHVTVSGKIIYVRRIRYLIDIPRHSIKKGDLGGFIEGEHNLLHEGDCVIKEVARVCEKAVVQGDAVVGNEAIIENKAIVKGEAYVQGKSHIGGNAIISDNSHIEHQAPPPNGEFHISGHARVYDGAKVTEHALLSGNVMIFEDAEVSGHACVKSNAKVYGDAVVSGHACILDTSIIFGIAYVIDSVTVRGTSSVENGDLRDTAEITNATLKNSNIRHDVLVQNSLLTDCAIENNAKIEASTLLFINVKDSAHLTDCEIINESNHFIIVSGESNLSHVQLCKSGNVLIKDRARLEYVKIDKVEHLEVSGEARLNGTESYNLLLKGKNTVLTGNCLLDSYKLGFPPMLIGHFINLAGHAHVKGPFILKDNVTIEDFGKLENSKGVTQEIQNTIINGDTVISY